MNKLTITLDDKIAAWVRVYAAKHNMSVSRVIGELLRQRMRESHEYDEAMRRFLRKAPVRLKRAGARYAKREETHDRSATS